MATTEELKHRKKRKQHKRKHYKNGSRTYLRISLGIGRINTILRRRKAKQTAEEARVERVIHEMIRCTGLRLGYTWGGGHVTPAPPNGPFDCSSYASHLCQVAVPKVKTGTTFSLASAAGSKGSGLAKGEGEFITLFIKNSPASDAHVIVRIIYKGRVYWTETGGRDNTGRGGPCIFRPTQSRIAEFPIHVHPNGL